MMKVSIKIFWILGLTFLLSSPILAQNGLPILPNSGLVDNTDEQVLRDWLISDGVASGTLLYKRSSDVFVPGSSNNSVVFHSKVDYQGPTLVLIKTNNGTVFGGYTNAEWGPNGSYVNGPKSFLFNLTTDKRGSVISPTVSIYSNSNYGPTFGGGHDIYVNNTMDGGYIRSSSYQPVDGSNTNSSTFIQALTGVSTTSTTFNFGAGFITEIEVYKIEYNVSSPNIIGQDITVSLDENGQASISANDIDNGSNDPDGAVTLSIDITDFTCDNLGGNSTAITPNFIGSESQNTHSWGGGYNPNTEEFWYPLWSGSTVHVYNKDHVFQRTFNSGQSSMMQLWADTDNPDDYYTANWGHSTITRRTGSSTVWSYNLGTTASGVATDADYVYAMPWTNSYIRVLDKNTGVLVRTINLPGQIQSYGGLVVANGFLYLNGNAIGWGSNPNDQRYIHQLDLDGNYIGSTETQGRQARITAFDGEIIWSSDHDNVIRGFQIADGSAYGSSGSGTNAVTLTVTDPSGNSISQIFSVTVEDAIAPTITLNGNAQMSVNSNTDENATFENDDPGATPSDNCSAEVEITGTVNMATPGVYTLSYKAIDQSGNESASLTREVTVIDATAPDAKAGRITVELDENGNASVDPASLDNGSTDNGNGTLIYTLDRTAFDCNDLNAEDGNSSSASETMTSIGSQSQETRSNGGGYNPNTNEFWYPEWSGTTVYVYDENHQFVRTFDSGQNSMMQIWMDTDSDTDYYTANWGNNTVTKRNGSSTVWSFNLGSTAGGVTTDEDYAYAMRSGGNYIAVLDKETGQFIRNINLPGSVSTQGGLVLANENFYITGVANGFSTNPNDWRFIHRLDMDGNYVSSISTSSQYPWSMAFDGEVMWTSPNSNTIYGTKISDGSAYSAGGGVSIVLTVTDALGNSSTDEGTIVVVDLLAPTITLNGNETMSTPLGTEFNDPSAAAIDNCSATIEVTGTVDINTLGAYTLTYKAIDGSGNESQTVTRTVNVVVADQDAPVITVKNVTVQLDANGNASIQEGQILADLFVESFSSDSPGVQSILTNWTFGNSGDNVDVGDYISGNNSTEIDLAGDNNSTITSKKTFHFIPGNYQISFDNRLNDNPSGNNSVNVTIGSLFNQTFASQSTVTSEVGTFTVSTETDAKVVFDQLGADDAAGSFIGNIRISKIIETSYAVFDGASDESGVVSMSVDMSAFDCSNLGTNQVELTVTDAYGNASTQTATVTIEDNIAPTVNLNGDATISLNQNETYTETATTEDNCSATLEVSGTVNTAVAGSYTLTYKATDASGNESEPVTRTVNVLDVTPPTIVCAEDVAINTDQGAATAQVQVTAPACEECGYSANTGTIAWPLRPYNNSTGSGSSAFSTSQDYVFNGPFPTATSDATLNIVLSGDINNTSSEYVNLRTEDGTIIDSRINSPDGNIDRDYTIDAVTFNRWAADGSIVFTIVGPPLSATNVNGGSGAMNLELDTPVTLVNDFNGTADASGTYPVGGTTVTWTATDAAGNQSNCTQIVTVSDVEQPVLSISDITVSTDVNTCDAIVGSFGGTASDNAGSADVTYNLAEGSTFSLGSTLVTATATDESGNTTEATFNVIVEDDIKPVVLTQDLVINLDEDGNVNITADQIDNGSTDNCSIQSLSLDVTSFDCNSLGNNTITLTVTDGSGNTETATAIVTVNDVTAPNVVTKDITVQLDENGNATVLPSQVNDGSDDNCAIETLSFGVSGDNGGQEIVPVTSGTRSGRDLTGINYTYGGETKTLTPSNAIGSRLVLSTLTAGSGDANRFWDANSTTGMTEDKALGVLGDFDLGTVFQDCGDPAGVKHDVMFDTPIIPGAGPEIFVVHGGLTQNIQILDTNGDVVKTLNINVNSSSSSVTIGGSAVASRFFGFYLRNNVNYAVQQLGTHGSTQNRVLALDLNASEVPEIGGIRFGGGGCNYTYEILGFQPEVGIASQLDFTCDNLGANTATLQATDATGNVSTETATVTVVDVIVPTISLTGNASVTHDAFTAYVDQGAVANDNCTVNLVTTDNVNTSVPGTYTVTYTATDGSGNETIATRTVVVRDVTAPTAIAQDITVQLDANGNASITPEDIDNGSSDDSGNVTLSLDQTEFDCDDLSQGGTSSAVTPTFVGTITQNSYSLGGGYNPRTDEWWYSEWPGTTVYRFDQNRNLLGSFESGLGTITQLWMDTDDDTYYTANYSEQVAIKWNDSNEVIWTQSFDYNVSGITTDENYAYVLLHNTSIIKVVNKQTGEFVRDMNLPGIIQTSNAIVQANGKLYFTGNALDWSDFCCNFGSVHIFDIATETYESSFQSGYNLTYSLAFDGEVIWTSRTQEERGFRISDGNAYESGGNTVNLLVTDPSGNTSTASANVTVEDNILPVITAPADINVFATSAAGAVVNYTAPVGTDNCTVTTALTAGLADGATFPIGTTVVTYTATDGSGNEALASFNVNVTGIAPVITQADITVDTDAGVCGAVVTYSATETTVGIPAADITYTIAPGSSFGVGTVAVTATATNAVGTSTATFNVTVVDNEAPEFLTRESFIIFLDENGAATVTPDDFNRDTVIDNCDIASLTFDRTTFDCNEVGFHEINITATDANGNVTVGQADVEVRDEVAPTVITKNIIVDLDENGNAFIIPSDVDGGTFDNCAFTLRLNIQSFSCAEIGDNVVELTAEDQNGVFSSALATVTVRDLIAPQVEGLMNLNVNLDALGNASIDVADFFGLTNEQLTSLNKDYNELQEEDDDCGEEGEGDCDGADEFEVPGVGSASNFFFGTNIVLRDNCGFGPITADKTDFTCVDIGENIVTITVTDLSGNSTEVQAIVTINDVTAAQVITQDIVVDLDANGNASITADMIDAGSNDACGIASLSLDNSTFDCSNVGANTVTLTVTDHNGNQSTAIATITVEDNIAPIALAQPLTVQLNEDGMGIITAEQVNAGSNDACGIASLSLDTTRFFCDNIGTNTVTLTVTDINGNVGTAEATITVEDNVAPEVITTDVTVALDANGAATITAGDINAGSNDACGIATMVLDITSFDCTNTGANVVTLTVTDVNGNVSSADATVTVVDVIAPTVITTDITVALDENGAYTITASNIDGGSFDNCAFDLTIDNNAFDCTTLGANTVNLTATDASGNITTLPATVTVIDNAAPTIVAQPITVELDENGAVSIVAAQVDGGTYDNCAVSSVTIDMDSFTCDNLGDNIVTITATDVNGNAASAPVVVTVVDVIAPTVGVQSISVDLDENGVASISPEDVLLYSEADVLRDTECDLRSSTLKYVMKLKGDKYSKGASYGKSKKDDDKGKSKKDDDDDDDKKDDDDDDKGDDDDDDDDKDSKYAQYIFDGTGGKILKRLDGSLSLSGVLVNQNDANDSYAISLELIGAYDYATWSSMDRKAKEVKYENYHLDWTYYTIASGSLTGSGINAGTTVDLGDYSYKEGFQLGNWANGENGDEGLRGKFKGTSDDDFKGELKLDVSNCELLPVPAGTVYTSDNCSIVDFSFNQDTFTCNDLNETTVMLTATDQSGNATTVPVSVTVNDRIAPVAVAQNITVSLGANGSVTVDPSLLDGGSTDNTNCALTFTLDRDTFDCDDITKEHSNGKGKGHNYGDDDDDNDPGNGNGYGHKKNGGHKVTLTVTDAAGNSSSATAYITVVDDEAPVISSAPITVVVDGKKKAYLSKYDVENAVTDNCKVKDVDFRRMKYDRSDAGMNSVQVTATDYSGNSTTGNVSVNVVDLSNYGKYVDMCYNGQSIRVKKNSVQKYLRKGASLGSCQYTARAGSEGRTVEVITDEVSFAPELTLSSYPNPTAGYTVISFSSQVDGPARVSILSTNGVQMASLFDDELVAKQEVEIGYEAGQLPSGIYIVRMVTAGEVKTIKLVVRK